MIGISWLNGKIATMQRERVLDRLVKPGLRSRVGPKTIGFASREPVEAVLANGTLVLYDGAVVKLAEHHVSELKSRAGYRIWERMVEKS
jgi:hypothetical protein